MMSVSYVNQGAICLKENEGKVARGILSTSLSYRCLKTVSKLRESHLSVVGTENAVEKYGRFAVHNGLVRCISDLNPRPMERKMDEKTS